jgi:hypothetical protein
MHRLGVTLKVGHALDLDFGKVAQVEIAWQEAVDPTIGVH